MAIVIEKEKRRINWLLIFSFLVIGFIVISGVYYLFFVNPARVEVFIPLKLKSLSELQEIDFNPNQLVNNPEFQALKPWAEFNLPEAEDIGKLNPFKP